MNELEKSIINAKTISDSVTGRMDKRYTMELGSKIGEELDMYNYSLSTKNKEKYDENVTDLSKFLYKVVTKNPVRFLIRR